MPKNPGNFLMKDGMPDSMGSKGLTDLLICPTFSLGLASVADIDLGFPLLGQWGL